jgi:hypothetical protein
MDWVTTVDWPRYVEIEPGELSERTSDLLARVTWVVLALIVLPAVATWYRRRNGRRAFWCALAGRDVEVEFAGSSVRSCSAFEDATAVACDRRCVDVAFRSQWDSALPVVSLPSGRRVGF